MSNKEPYGYVYMTREAWPGTKDADGRTVEIPGTTIFRARNAAEAIESFLRRVAFLKKTMPNSYSELWAVKIYRNDIQEVSDDGRLTPSSCPWGTVFEWKCDFPGSLESCASTEIEAIKKSLAEDPYIEVTHLETEHVWNPDYPEDAECECGHQYYRHFDWYEENSNAGCKYCDCFEFKLKKD